MVCQHVFSGIRLAIGALEREVLTQFLVEAVVLSSFGGLIGIVLALAGSLWLSAMLHVPFVFNGGIVLIAFLFSASPPSRPPAWIPSWR